jgi:transcriptional regulator with XRE-family HTH domain
VKSVSDEDLRRWLRESLSLGDILRRLRETQQLTVREVADYADLAPSYVSALERGIRQPERDTLIALLLAAFSLPVSLANRVLLFAGFAPMHHRALAVRAPLAIASDVEHGRSMIASSRQHPQLTLVDGTHH